MAKSGKKSKQDEQVEEAPVEEHVEGEQPTRRPKKVPALGKSFRSGPRQHRESRRRGFHHLLTEEGEEETEFS